MSCSANHSARIAPAPDPLDDDVQQAIDRVLRGRPPLALFTTIARDRRLFFKLFDAGLLDRGHLSLREREIVIDRVTALCGAEYEWGVHVAVFAQRAGLEAEHVRSLTFGGPADDCWAEQEALLLRLCDELQVSATVGDDLWHSLAAAFSAEALLELLMLAGHYRTISYLALALRLPLEPGSARFADYGPETP